MTRINLGDDNILSKKLVKMTRIIKNDWFKKKISGRLSQKDCEHVDQNIVLWAMCFSSFKSENFGTCSPCTQNYVKDYFLKYSLMSLQST